VKNLKKFLVVTVAFVFVLAVSGCEKVEEGNYKEGTYFASVVDDYNGAKNTATAVMYVNEDGVIKSLTLDTTYTSGDVGSTKKALGAGYNMKTYNTAAAGEWYEQVEKLENAVVEAQGIDEITVGEDGTTDSVTGCTIKVSALMTVTEDVLTQAKK